MGAKYYTNAINRKGQPFDIIFECKKGGIISRLIWHVSRKWYGKVRLKTARKSAHVLFYLGNNTVIEINQRGVKIERMRDRKRAKYFMYLGRSKQRPDKAKLLDYNLIMIGKLKYDFQRALIILLQAYGLMGPVGDYTKDMVICSEHISSSFLAQAIRLLDMEPCDTKPLDLLQSSELEIIDL